MKQKKVECEWRDNGDLTVWVTLPAFIHHPVTQEEIWFNQASSSHYSYHQSHPMVKLEQHF